MSQTIKEALTWASSYLKKKGIDSYKLDSELILAKILSQDRIYLYTYPEKTLLPEEITEFVKKIKERGKRYPLAYIVNEKEFFGRKFYVGKGSFCPRPETEILVEEVIKTLSKKSKVKIFEIGLGTGVISITLALEIPSSFIFACDIDERAIFTGKQNIKSFGLEDRIKIFRGDLFQCLKNVKFDCIVSNPPYLSKKDFLEAEAEVKREPKRALMAKDRGLAIIKRIVYGARDFLKDDGWLFIEIGHGQGSEVLNMVQKIGFIGQIIPDLAGKERVLKAKKIS